MGKKLLIAAVIVLALGVVNLTLLLIVQSRRAVALEQQIARLDRQLANNQSAASTPGLSPMEEIHRAIEGGDLPQLRALLDAHPDLLNASTHNAFRSTPLQFAAWNNRPDLAAELIRRGADVNSVNKDGRTALHDAISANSPQIVRLLLDHGVDIHLSRAPARDPAIYAAESKRTAIAEMLRQPRL